MSKKDTRVRNALRLRAQALPTRIADGWQAHTELEHVDSPLL